MSINKEEQPNYNKEELKPKWVSTPGFKYQIFQDHVDFLTADCSNVILRINNDLLSRINESKDNYVKGGYYTGQCIDCHKLDGLVNGYCKPCFDKSGLEYEDVAK